MGEGKTSVSEWQGRLLKYYKTRLVTIWRTSNARRGRLLCWAVLINSVSRRCAEPKTSIGNTKSRYELTLWSASDETAYGVKSLQWWKWTGTLLREQVVVLSKMFSRCNMKYKKTEENTDNTVGEQSVTFCKQKNYAENRQRELSSGWKDVLKSLAKNPLLNRLLCKLVQSLTKDSI